MYIYKHMVNPLYIYIYGKPFRFISLPNVRNEYLNLSLDC